MKFKKIIYLLPVFLLVILLSPFDVYGKVDDGWKEIDEKIVTCIKDVYVIGGHQTATREIILSISPSHKNLKATLDYCGKIVKSDEKKRENFECKVKNKKTGKLVDYICSYGFYSKINGKNKLVSIKEVIKSSIKKGSKSVKYGKFIVSKTNVSETNTLSKKNGNSKNSKEDKISKNEFLKKYYGKKEFNQRSEMKKVLGHFFEYIDHKGNSENRNPYSHKWVVYISEKFLVMFSVTKIIYGGKNVHFPDVIPIDLKNNVINLHYLDKTHVNNQYNGVKIGLPRNKKRLMFKKGEYLYNYNINKQSYQKYKIISQSYQGLKNSANYKWVANIHDYREATGNVIVCCGENVHNFMYSLYEKTGAQVKYLKEKNIVSGNNQTYDVYSVREKTLGEKVLNYTTTGALEGKKNNYWFALKNKKCVFKPAGKANWGGFGSSNKDPINIRNINQTAFKIAPSNITWGGQYVGFLSLTSGNKTYFDASEALDVGRLSKAWKMLFQKCPGKKTTF